MLLWLLLLLWLWSPALLLVKCCSKQVYGFVGAATCAARPWAQPLQSDCSSLQRCHGGICLMIDFSAGRSMLLELLCASTWMWDVLELVCPNWSAAWETKVMRLVAPLLHNSPMMLKTRLGSRSRRVPRVPTKFVSSTTICTFADYR